MSLCLSLCSRVCPLSSLRHNLCFERNLCSVHRSLFLVITRFSPLNVSMSISLSISLSIRRKAHCSRKRWWRYVFSRTTSLRRFGHWTPILPHFHLPFSIAVVVRNHVTYILSFKNIIHMLSKYAWSPFTWLSLLFTQPPTLLSFYGNGPGNKSIFSVRRLWITRKVIAFFNF